MNETVKKDNADNKTEALKTDSSTVDQGKKQTAIIKRIGKRADKANAENTRLTSELEASKQETALLQQQLNPTPAQKPTLADCENDPERFDTELNRWYQGQSAVSTKTSIDKAVNEIKNTQAIESHDNRIQGLIDNHYEKANEANVEGYEIAEANALDWLGEKIFQGVIEVADNSPEVLFLLGSNKEEAEKLVTLLKTNPTKGTAEIGRLSARAVKFEKSDGVPDPETNLEGGGTPVSNAHLKRQHDEIVKRAMSTGNNEGLSAVRAKMREAGMDPDAK